MAGNGDLVTQGIMAYEAGELKEANRLLTQAVKDDKNNEQAWFYLGMAQSNPKKKKQAMERVLKINSDNEKAKQELANLETLPQDDAVDKAKKRANEAMDQKVSMNYGVVQGIPGAPNSLSLGVIFGVIQSTITESIPIFTKQAEVKLKEASWWNFFLTVSVFSFLIGLLGSIAGLVVMLDNEFITFDLLPLLSNPILVMLTGTIAVSGGAFLSHWFASKQDGGQASLVAHSLTLAKIWALPSLVLAIIQFLVTVISVLSNDYIGGIIKFEGILRGGFPRDVEGGTLVLTIIAIAITGYSAFLMAKNLGNLHGVSKQLWIPALIMVVVTAIVF